MINRCWGIELWDQIDNVNKHTDKTIQFFERYESFLKDRCTIEDDYARALKKLTKTYTPKLKEQEDFYNKYTFTMAFCSTLKELNDIASQHELIGESIRERSIKQIQSTIKDCREQRKKYLDEYQKVKRQLDKQYDVMIKSLRKYEESFDSSRRAKENFDKANEDLDLSRAQLEKFREMMNLKSKVSDETHAAYVAQLSTFNESQRSFYERQLPTILSDLQRIDNKHSDEFKQTSHDFIQAHGEVLPRIRVCLDEMSKQTKLINAMNDAQTVIEEYKTGYPIPEDLKPIDLNNGDVASPRHDQPVYEDFLRSNTLKSTMSEQNPSNGASSIYAVSNANVHLNGSQTLTIATSETTQRKRSGKSSTIRKIFGGSNQRKSILSPTMNANAPYANLPPAQRLKKFQEHIQNCKNELDKQQKAKEGLIKMKAVFQENPKFGDEHDVTQQIGNLDGQIEKLSMEIKRFESYIGEVERTTETDFSARFRQSTGSDQSISPDHYGSHVQKRSSPEYGSTSTRLYDQSSSSDYQHLPSLDQQDQRRKTFVTDDDHNASFEDEDHSIITDNRQRLIKAFALYDFTGHGSDGFQYVNAATMAIGECVFILDDDHGDGWTRIEKQDGSTGFVPSTYLRVDTLDVYESNRF